MLKTPHFRYCVPYLFAVPLQRDSDRAARTGGTSAKSKLSAFGLHCPCRPIRNGIVNDYGTIKETFYELCLSARTDGTRHAEVYEPLPCAIN